MPELKPPPGSPNSDLNVMGLPKGGDASQPAPKPELPQPTQPGPVDTGHMPGTEPAISPPPAPPAPVDPAQALADREAAVAARETALEEREKRLEAKLDEGGFAPGAVTQADIDQMVIGTYSFCAYDALLALGETNFQPETVAALQCTTVAVLVLRNGFVLVGDSVCAMPEAYDGATGRKWAVEDAKRVLWPLENYLRKSVRAGLLPGHPHAGEPVL